MYVSIRQSAREMKSIQVLDGIIIIFIIIIIF